VSGPEAPTLRMHSRSRVNNLLLHKLPQAEFNRLAPHLEEVDLELGQVLFEAGEARQFAYFPTRGIVSVMQELEGGAGSEIALIGHHGLVGITAILGGTTQPNRVVVQNAGRALRIPADVLAREMRRGGVLMTVLLLYIQVLYTQVAQSAVCNRHHNVQQLLCRWLLLSLDCIDNDELTITQELIAGTLGVRREGITRAARQLQNEHVIEYRRGVIRALDRPRLEAMSCECYRVITEETRRLMGKV